MLENIFDGEESVVCDVEGPKSRWYTAMIRIFVFEGHFYGVKWNRGATENQANEYLDPAGPTVELDEYVQMEKIIKVWEPI